MKIKIISIGNKMPSWIKEAFNSYISKLDCEFSSELIEIKPEKKFSSIEQKKNPNCRTNISSSLHFRKPSLPS